MILKTKVYNLTGQEAGEIKLPLEIFGLKINNDLLYQVVVAQAANRRQVLAHAKDRSEKRGGGRKPWQQKGTGRARHGSIRSPLWIGGGVTFGPTKEKVFTKKINKKMKRQALFMALSGKFKDKELIIVDDFKISQTKTKEINKLLNQILDAKNINQKKSILIVLPASEPQVIRATNNISWARVIRADSLNVLDLLSYQYCLMPQSAIQIIKKTFGK